MAEVFGVRVEQGGAGGTGRAEAEEGAVGGGRMRDTGATVAADTGSEYTGGVRGVVRGREPIPGAAGGGYRGDYEGVEPCGYYNRDRGREEHIVYIASKQYSRGDDSGYSAIGFVARGFAGAVQEGVDFQFGIE